MSETEDTLKEVTLAQVLDAVNQVNSRLDDAVNLINSRLDTIEENIRLQSMSVDARFDRLEAISLDAKSVALMAKSQLTILTEEVRAWSKEVQELKV